VNNYKALYRLGMKIINHKHQIKYVLQLNVDSENAKQEERIEKFEKMLMKTHREWKQNKKSINEYWTGH
tara:strand:- start:2075 stop:2281 length:207 start_codon:yes stop_codon:yes gene_type:complete